jgi:hypothetical protein
MATFNAKSESEAIASGELKPYIQKYGKEGAYDVYAAEQFAKQEFATKGEKEAASNTSALVAKQALRNAIASSQGKRKEWYIKLLQSLDNTASATGDAFEGLDKYTINAIKNLHSVHTFIQDGITSTTSGIAGSINNATRGLQQFEEEAIHDIQGWGAGVKKALEPVGLCSAIGDLTDVAKNPLGAPQFLANSLTSLVGKISPSFVQKMDDSFTSLKLEGLAHLPSKMMGSIRSLATAADAILSVPFEIMSDVYNGLMDILEAIADLIDGLVTLVMNLAMSVVKALVDAIIPVEELLEFFSAVGDLASFVGDIAGMVGGFSAVTNITSQVTDIASSATSLINNPLQLIPGANQAIGQVTGSVGQITGALRNPEQFLPPEISQQMQKISQIPGLGFVGNLGYSVGDALDTLSDGVFEAALGKYADKSPMIKSFFNKPQDEPPAVDTQEAYSDDYDPPKAGIHSLDGAGNPAIVDTSSYKIFKEDASQQNTDSVSAFGFTERKRNPSDPVVIEAYGAREERFSDGSSVITAPNGQRVRRFPDGREVAI